MNALRDFEMEAIRLMAGHALSGHDLNILQEAREPTRYTYTGCGYYIAIADPGLPAREGCLSEPAVVGTAGKFVCGFVLYLGINEIVLECHTWGEFDIPDDFRERDVTISTPPINNVDLRDQAT